MLEPLCGLLERVMLDERIRRPVATADNFRVLAAMTNVSAKIGFDRYGWMSMVQEYSKNVPRGSFVVNGHAAMQCSSKTVLLVCVF